MPRVTKKKPTPRQKKTTRSKSESILLIGPRGFKGENILRRLEANSKYKKIIAVDSFKPDIPLKKTKFYKFDITAPMADVALAEIMKAENCKTVIHTAFPITPVHNRDYAHELIAIGAYYIFNACEAAKIKKVLMITTTDVYGPFPTNPNYLTEDMPTKGYLNSKFIGDKIDAEKQALRFAKQNPSACVTILRPCTILGPTIQSYKTQYLQRPIVTTILGFDPLFQFVHEEDVIDAAEMFLEKNLKGIYNLAGDGVLPLSRIIEICGKVNLKLPQIGFKTMVKSLWTLDLSPAPVSHVDFLRYLCVVDNEKIKKAGFKPKYTTKETLLSFVGAERLRQVNLFGGHAS